MSDQTHHRIEHNTRCAAIVELLNTEYSWGLSVEERQAYLDALGSYLSVDCPDAQLRRTVLYYHADHNQVAALRDHAHAQHEAAWATLTAQVQVIIRQHGMAWSDDAAIDVDDLSQIARIELLRSLGSYRYASRFSTWVTQVVIRSVRCAIRDGRALKRHGRSLSLDQPGVPDAAISVAEAPDSVSGANLLAEQIDTVLSQSADARLARIFRLWAVADLSTAEIGALVKLHPSRVRALLLQARLALRQHPEIQTWQEHDEYLHL